MTQECKRILSIDSGAIKGLIPIFYLYFLEQDLKTFGLYDSIFDAFDMYAGTSVGSIVIGGIVYTDLDMKDLVEQVFTKENMQTIFNSNFFFKFLNIIRDRPLYDGKSKKELINKYIGSETLITETKSKDVVIPVYSMDEHSPKFYKSYKMNSTIKDPAEIRMFSECDPTVKIAEIINASSAAPIYFPPAIYNDQDGEHLGLDGTVMAGNPSDIIYADALKLYPEHDIRILSIGTGLSDHKKINISEALNYGAIQWITKGSLLSIVSENHDIDAYVTQYFTKANGHKHIRIQESIVDVKLDDTSKYEYLYDLAKKWYTETREHVFRDVFDYTI